MNILSFSQGLEAALTVQSKKAKRRFCKAIALSLSPGSLATRRLTESKGELWMHNATRVLKGTGCLFHALFCLLWSNLPVL